MPTLTITQGTLPDLTDVLALLQMSGLSGSGVPGQIANFLIAREGGRAVAVAGLEDHGVAGLIRSVASHPGWRSRGLSTTLVRALIDRSRALGHQAVYLRTATAEGYFTRFGFRRATLEEVMPAVLASDQFQGEECSSTAIMVLEFANPEAQY